MKAKKNEGMGIKFSEEQTRELARAAQIALTDAEVAAFAGDLERLFLLADALLDIPLTADAERDAAFADMNGLREDKPISCLPREALLRAAPRQRDGYVVVPRAVEE